MAGHPPRRGRRGGSGRSEPGAWDSIRRLAHRAVGWRQRRVDEHDLLDTQVRSSAESLLRFAERLDRFEYAYRAVVSSVVGEIPLIVCTIYNGALPPDQARLARGGRMTSTTSF
jgi:hypothetical protein